MFLLSSVSRTPSSLEFSITASIAAHLLILSLGTIIVTSSPSSALKYVSEAKRTLYFLPSEETENFPSESFIIVPIIFLLSAGLICL